MPEAAFHLEHRAFHTEDFYELYPDRMCRQPWPGHKDVRLLVPLPKRYPRAHRGWILRQARFPWLPIPWGDCVNPYTLSWWGVLLLLLEAQGMTLPGAERSTGELWFDIPPDATKEALEAVLPGFLPRWPQVIPSREFLEKRLLSVFPDNVLRARAASVLTWFDEEVFAGSTADLSSRGLWLRRQSRFRMAASALGVHPATLQWAACAASLTEK